MDREQLKTKFIEVTKEIHGKIRGKLSSRFRRQSTGAGASGGPSGSLKERLLEHLKNFSMEPAEVTGFITRAVQRQGFGFYGTFGTVVLCAYFISDLTSLGLGKFIPEPPLARSMRFDSATPAARSPEDYAVIWGRNLFNAEGKIPGEDQPAQGVGNNEAPVRTSLPFNLIGTLVLADELRSIGTIEDKSASMVYPVRVEDEIPSKARILKVEPRKVIFVNLASGRKEFVELPEDPAGDGPKISLGTRAGAGTGLGASVEQVAPAQFNVARVEIDKAFSDLNNVLTQARAVPHFENGAPAGYKLFQIVPNSIYDKLGLKDGDIIKGFDNQAVNDPAKALEALNNLRNSSHVEIQVVRNGKPQNLVYDIR
jgi:general secretion pathway protein C